MKPIKLIVTSLCKIYSSKIINKFSTEYIHLCIHVWIFHSSLACLDCRTYVCLKINMLNSLDFA